MVFSSIDLPAIDHISDEKPVLQQLMERSDSGCVSMRRKVAPRAGFEPATNRLTAVDTRATQ